MTTDPDRTARIEFDAAAYLIYAKEHTMNTTRITAAAQGCTCDEAEEMHDHCQCGAVLTWLEGDRCRSCEHACQDCGAPIPDEGDGFDRIYCADCATSRVYAESGLPSEHAPDFIKGIMVLVALAALALSLTTHTAHAAPYTPTAPIGCTVTRFWHDDLSAMAVCAGGYTLHKESGPFDIWDIPYAIGTITVGPDANGAYHEYTRFD
jgi:hypothetical protein